jgi:lipoprotein signal peptidase
LPLAVLACLLAGIDQVTKAVRRAVLLPGKCVALLDEVLRLTFVQNFSEFSWWVPPLPAWANWVLQFVLALIVLAASPVHLFYTNTRRQSVWAEVAVVSIPAAGLGHLLDGLFVTYGGESSHTARVCGISQKFF